MRRRVDHEIVIYKNKSKTILYFIFGIGIFLLVFFPLYGIMLRYQIGALLRRTIDIIGVCCLTFGTIIMIMCIVSLIAGRSIRIGYFIAAIVMLWIGCWVSGIVVDVFGFTFGDKSAGTGGYN